MKIVSLNQKIHPFYKIQNIKLKRSKIFKVKVTEKLHKDFIKLSGDNSPIHQNKKFLKKNNYEEKLGHGFLITTILSQIYGKYFPGGSELCIRQTCFFREPFFVGEMLKIKVIPQKKNIKLKLLEVSIDIEVKNKIIFNGEATFVLSLKR